MRRFCYYGQGDKWIRGHVFKRTGPVMYNIKIGNNIVPETAPESKEIASTGCIDLDHDVDLNTEAEPSNLHNQNPERLYDVLTELENFLKDRLKIFGQIRSNKFALKIDQI